MRLSILFSACILCLLLICSCNHNPPPSGEQQAKAIFNRNTDSLLAALDQLDTMISRQEKGSALQTQFAVCRRLFKKNEAVTEYYFQGLTRRINGPALPDVRTEDGVVWPPHGFQVIEQLLYGAQPDTGATNLLRSEVQLLQTDLRFVKNSLQHQALLPRHAAELVQHQLIRIATLGITGFDAPVSLQSLPEAVAALTGIKEFCVAYYGDTAWNAGIEQGYRQANAYVGQHNQFELFDRLAYLTRYLMPLSRQLATLRRVSDSDDQLDSLFKRPFTGTLDDLMKGRGFDADYYATYAQGRTTPDKVLLGEKLFSDSRLSRSGRMSCANCHHADRAFTDGLAKASNLVHGGNLLRNTPTLYYAALQSHQFYDLRSTTIEDQIYDVMQSGNEFASSDREIARKIIGDTTYRRLFARAFGQTDSISGYNIRNAMAAYIRSLNPFASPFDAYMNGRNDAIGQPAITGFNLFMGKAKCGTCHFMPLFNGNTPPWFNHSESEIIGVPAKATWANSTIDGDEGRYRINRIAALQYAFKTPTLRNVSRTAPYMHNGVYKTLDEVVEFYHRGGGTGIGIDLPNQSLPFDSLVLSPAEKQSIVSFMQTLTDRH